MGQEWAERQRRTHDLVRSVASYLLRKPTVSPNQMYGLCRLTWVTRSFEDNSAYIRSTKIPALRDIFETKFRSTSLTGIAAEIGEITESSQIETAVLATTGFTNFYNAYRNSSRPWIRRNAAKVQSLFRMGFSLDSDSVGLDLVGQIERLPMIPKENQPAAFMSAGSLLTPVLFALDPRFRFPLMNRNKGVQRLLTHYKVNKASLSDKYLAMVALYGRGGITDAADLDQAGRDLPDFIELDGKPATKQFLGEKPTKGNKLPIKDEEDHCSLREALSVVQRRLHNKMTNTLRKHWAKYTLIEGSSKAALFDVLIQNFDKQKNELMVEVKSSIEPAHVRMAIGQLCDYWFTTNGESERKVAIVLPQSPYPETHDLLRWLGIGLLWFEGGALRTDDEWLTQLEFAAEV